MNRFCDVYINICDKAKYDWQFWCLYRHFWCPAVSEIVFCNFLDEDCMTGKIATLEVSLEGKALTTPVLLEHNGWKSPKKLHFRKITKLTIFGIFNQLLSTQNVSVARFARNFEWDFFCDFQPLCSALNVKNFESCSTVDPKCISQDQIWSSSSALWTRKTVMCNTGNSSENRSSFLNE